MRDYLMGYPAAARAAVELEDAGEMAIYFRHWVDPYPCGVPGRVLAEGEEAFTAIASMPDPWETENRPLPDGSFVLTPKQVRFMEDRVQQMLATKIRNRLATTRDEDPRLQEAWTRMGELEAKLAQYERDLARRGDPLPRQLAMDWVNDSRQALTGIGVITAASGAQIGFAVGGLPLTLQGSSLKT